MRRVRVRFDVCYSRANAPISYESTTAKNRRRTTSSSARRRQMSPRVFDHGFRDVRVHVSIVAVALATAVVATRGPGMSTAASGPPAAAAASRVRGAGAVGPVPATTAAVRGAGRGTPGGLDGPGGPAVPGDARLDWHPESLVLRHRVAVEPAGRLGRRGPVQRDWQFRFRQRTDRRLGGGGPWPMGLASAAARSALRRARRAAASSSTVSPIVFRGPRCPD